MQVSLSILSFLTTFLKLKKKERKTNFALNRELRCVNMQENGEKKKTQKKNKQKNTTIEEKKKDIIAKKRNSTSTSSIFQTMWTVGTL